jgi:hypothetical protein
MATRTSYLVSGTPRETGLLKKYIRIYFTVIMLLLLGWMVFSAGRGHNQFPGFGSRQKTLTYSLLLSDMKQNKISTASFHTDSVSGKLDDGTDYTANLPANHPELELELSSEMTADKVTVDFKK